METYTYSTRCETDRIQIGREISEMGNTVRIDAYHVALGSTQSFL